MCRENMVSESDIFNRLKIQIASPAEAVEASREPVVQQPMGKLHVLRAVYLYVFVYIIARPRAKLFATAVWIDGYILSVRL